MTLNAFHWRKNASESGLITPEKVSPQLAYYRRKLALGIHPIQLRRKGLPVLRQAEAVALANAKRRKDIQNENT